MHTVPSPFGSMLATIVWYICADTGTVIMPLTFTGKPE